MEEWIDRDRTEQLLPPTAVYFRVLKYDPDTGQYCHSDDEPFTGVCITRWPDGRLQSVVHFVNGHAHGVSVAWSIHGRPEVYNEMEFGVCHGLHVKWSEDGSVVEEFRCHEGRQIKF